MGLHGLYLGWRAVTAFTAYAYMVTLADLDIVSDLWPYEIWN